MEAKQHMAFKNTKSLQAPLRKLPQMRARPFVEKRINRENVKKRIFPFNQPIEGRACALRHMKKDQRLRAVRGCNHEQADGTFLILMERFLCLGVKENSSLRDAKGRTWGDDAAMGET